MDDTAPALEPDGAPTRTDPVAAALSAVVGGPMGDHAAGHPWWSASRVLVGATGVVLAAGMLAKGACVPTGWSNDKQPYAELCWTGLAGRPADSGTPPHVTTWLERLAGLFPGTGTVSTTAGLAVLLAALALLTTVLLARVDERRPWAAAGWALSPLLLVHWLSWELVAAVGVAVLLWGWTTGRTWLAGVGAGVGAAFAPPVAVAFVGVVAVGGRLRDRVDALVAAAAAYVVVTLPGRGHVEDPDVGSIWLFLQASGAPGSRTFRMTVSLVVLALAAAAAVWVSTRSRRTVRTSARVGLLMMVAALLVSPAAAPELALLALPLAAVAVRRWRDLLVWQGCQLVSWVITGWWIGDALLPTVTDDDRAYWLAIMLRVVGLVWLAVIVLRDSSGDDDSVEVGRGEADPDVDLLADQGHARA